MLYNDIEDIPFKSQYWLFNFNDKVHVIWLNIVWYYDNKNEFEEAIKVYEAMNNWFNWWNVDIKKINFELYKQLIDKWLNCNWRNKENLCDKLKSDFLKLNWRTEFYQYINKIYKWWYNTVDKDYLKQLLNELNFYVSIWWLNWWWIIRRKYI